ncbi:MAG TPA: bifunctional 3-phenylpropionate/cinnamic acid dioxygenase ferredoxin subunit [Verrucomicrobiae bacterium]|nr:bifunctional 3-phenylpropionate/cinnamic acid dioxygenase ferredoxin subunit [Verrucomicrobiae bacterium]
MSEFIRVCEVAAIPSGHAARVEIGDSPVAVFNVAGRYFALDDTCSHALASLSDGELDLQACAIECPLHGSQFDLRTGVPLCLPAVDPVRTHAILVKDGALFVQLSAEPE